MSTMQRRCFLKGLAAAAGALAVPASLRAAAAKGKPNFLVIVADDMGFSDPGCYGGEIATPNLDRLAANGLRFTQFYSTGRCWPSRSCIMTGYYAQQVNMDPRHDKVPSWGVTLPKRLKPFGYRSYHSGKWHVDGAGKPVTGGGFDRSYDIEDHNRFFYPKNALLDDQPLPPVPEGTDFYLTTEIASRAVSFLEEHRQQHADAPFFLYLAFTSPHFPLHARQDDIDRYRDRYTAGWDKMREERYRRMLDLKLVDCALSKRDPETVPGWNLPPEKLKEQIGPGEVARAVAWDDLTPEEKAFQSVKMAIHAAMVDRMDREIGRVLDQVKKMGAMDDTVIFFVSDNGASAEQIIRGDMHDPAAPPGSGKTFLCLGPGWSTCSNTPFRRHKSWVHEGGVASPLIVHWPAGIAARGELRKNPGHFVDLLPTIVGLASGRPPEVAEGGPPLPGKDLAPVFAKDVVIPRDCIYFHHEKNRAIRIGDWKLVAEGADGPWELYDLSKDRAEAVNLAAKYPEKVRELEGIWKPFDDRWAPPPRAKQPAGAAKQPGAAARRRANAAGAPKP